MADSIRGETETLRADIEARVQEDSQQTTSAQSAAAAEVTWGQAIYSMLVLISKQLDEPSGAYEVKPK